MNGVEISQPAELCEVFRFYFSSTFRNYEGNGPLFITTSILLKMSKGFILSVKLSVSELNSRAIAKVKISVK